MTSTRRQIRDKTIVKLRRRPNQQQPERQLSGNLVGEDLEFEHRTPQVRLISHVRERMISEY